MDILTRLKKYCESADCDECPFDDEYICYFQSEPIPKNWDVDYIRENLEQALKGEKHGNRL